MKLVNFEDFCRMPAGTIFAPYEPCVFKEGLAIKTDTGYDMPPDYPYCSHTFLGVMSLEPDFETGTEFALWEVGDQLPASFSIYDGSNADYDDDDIFLVFEEADVDRLINALVWAKNGCVGEPDCSVNK